MYWTIVPIVGYSIFIEWLCRSVSLHLFAHQKCSPYLSCIYCSGSIHACTQQTMIFAAIVSQMSLCPHSWVLCAVGIKILQTAGSDKKLTIFAACTTSICKQHTVLQFYWLWSEIALIFNIFLYPTLHKLSTPTVHLIAKAFEYTIHEKHEPLYIKLRVQCDD